MSRLQHISFVIDWSVDKAMELCMLWDQANVSDGDSY